MRPDFVDASLCADIENRNESPPRVTATAYGGSGSPPSTGSGIGSTRGSNESIATIRSPSSSLKNFCTGSPYPVVAGTSWMRIT